MGRASGASAPTRARSRPGGPAPRGVRCSPGSGRPRPPCRRGAARDAAAPARRRGRDVGRLVSRMMPAASRRSSIEAPGRAQQQEQQAGEGHGRERRPSSRRGRPTSWPGPATAPSPYCATYTAWWPTSRPPSASRANRTTCRSRNDRRDARSTMARHGTPTRRDARRGARGVPVRRVRPWRPRHRRRPSVSADVSDAPSAAATATLAGPRADPGADRRHVHLQPPRLHVDPARRLERDRDARDRWRAPGRARPGYVQRRQGDDDHGRRDHGRGEPAALVVDLPGRGAPRGLPRRAARGGGVHRRWAASRRRSARSTSWPRRTGCWSSRWRPSAARRAYFLSWTDTLVPTVPDADQMTRFEQLLAGFSFA